MTELVHGSELVVGDKVLYIASSGSKRHGEVRPSAWGHRYVQYTDGTVSWRLPTGTTLINAPRPFQKMTEEEYTESLVHYKLTNGS